MTVDTARAAEEKLIQSLLDCSNLTSWERSFVRVVAATKKRGSRQITKLEAIAARRLGGGA